MNTVKRSGIAIFPLLLIFSAGLPLAAEQVEVIPEVNHGLTIPMRLMSYDSTASQSVRPLHQIPSSGKIAAAAPEDSFFQEITDLR